MRSQGNKSLGMASAVLIGLVATASFSTARADLFVGDLRSLTIGEYAPSGTVVNPSLIPGPSGALASFAISGSDMFVINNNQTIGEYTTSGSLVNADLISGFINAS